MERGEGEIEGGKEGWREGWREGRRGEGEREKGGREGRRGEGEREKGGREGRRGEGEREKGGREGRRGEGEREKGGREGRRGEGEREKGGREGGSYISTAPHKSHALDIRWLALDHPGTVEKLVKRVSMVARHQPVVCSVMKRNRNTLNKRVRGTQQFHKLHVVSITSFTA